MVTSVASNSPPNSVQASPVVTPILIGVRLPVTEFDRTEIFVQALRPDLNVRVAVLAHHFHGHFAADRGDLAFKASHAGLFGVMTDDSKKRVVRENQVVRRETVGLLLLFH